MRRHRHGHAWRRSGDGDEPHGAAEVVVHAWKVDRHDPCPAIDAQCHAMRSRHESTLDEPFTTVDVVTFEGDRLPLGEVGHQLYAACRSDAHAQHMYPV